MRIVLCSDVHGNVVALQAVLDAIRQEAPYDALFVAGDLVLLGPRPAEALALLRTLDARFVMGNTDSYLFTRAFDVEQVEWARARLSEADLAFLQALPFEQRLEVAPGHTLLVVHANPRDLEGAIKPTSPDGVVRPMLAGVDADVIAFGHYHVPFVRQIDRYMVLDVASVGMPRDGDQRAVYAVLEWDGTHWHAEHRRVAFDIEAVAQDYHTVGFPGAAHAAARLLQARYEW